VKHDIAAGLASVALAFQLLSVWAIAEWAQRRTERDAAFARVPLRSGIGLLPWWWLLWILVTPTAFMTVVAIINLRSGETALGVFMAGTAALSAAMIVLIAAVKLRLDSAGNASNPPGAGGA
jgi:hypothetical protein